MNTSGSHKIIQLSLFGDPEVIVEPKDVSLEKKIERAIRLLQSAEKTARQVGQPLEICYSGGKDSDVILELARMAGISFRAIYKNTTIDPPGTIKHCKDNGVEIVRPKTDFFGIIRQKGFPTFWRRFCCEVLKEYKILDNAVQGIRRTESTKRAARYKAEEPVICRIYGSKKNHVNVVLPILTWTDEDVQKFVERRGIKCHPLYYDKQGRFDVRRRLGCMGCPLPHDRSIDDFKQHPALVRAWLRNGQIWWDTHKLKKLKKKYRSIYELFVGNMFFSSYKDFRYWQQNPLFGEIDCRKYIMDYFKIDLPTPNNKNIIKKQ